MPSPTRSGPFWDGVEGRSPVPPAARTLGFDLIAASEDSIEVAFHAGHEFTNPLGEVLGGFLAAMLYETVGPTVLSTLGDGEFIRTLDMSTYFLESATPGRLIGRGRILKRADDIVIVEADENGTVVFFPKLPSYDLPGPDSDALDGSLEAVDHVMA